MSNPSSASAVSGFTFKSIGKPPSLLSRIRDADSTLVSYPPAETSPSPPPGSAAPASPVVSQPAGKRSLLGRLEGVPSAAPTTPARPDIVANRTNSAAVVQDIFNIPLITPTSNLPANPTQTSNPVMSSFCLTIPPEPTAPSTFTSPVSTSAASNPTASRPSSTSIPPVDLHALALTATTADLYRRISELSTERMELNEASLARQRVLDAQREYLRRHEETRSAAVREKEQMDKLVDAVLDALQKTEKARERQEKRWAEDNLQLEKLLKAKAQDEEEEKRRKDEEARIQAQQEADAAAARKTQEELAERAARARKEAEEAKAREKAAAEKAARERREAEEAQAREKAAADKAAAEKAAAEKAAAEKAAAEKAAAEKAAAEKAAAEKAAAEKAAAEKAARERREVEEAKAREKEAAERAARARQEAEAAKARENEAAAARAKAAEEEAKAKERDMAEKIRQEREEKERLERLEAQARAKAEVARARAEKLEQDRMRAEVMAKTQAATAERVKKQAEERAKLPVAGASLDAAKSSNTATPIKVEKEQAIARPPSAASTTSQRPKAPQPVITTSKAAAPPRLDVPLPSPAPTPALSRGSQHPLAAPGLIPHVSRPPTPAQQRVLANTSNGLQQSLPQTQPPTHIPTIFQHPEDTVDVKPSLDTLQYPTTSASLRPTQTTDNIKTSPSMSSRKIQRSLWPPVSTPPTSTVSSQPTSSGPAHQPQIATPGIARVQSRDSSSQNGTARASKPTDSTPAYGVKPEPVEVPLPPQGTQKQTPQRVQQQQTSSANTKTTISAAPAVPPTRAPPIPRSTAVAQAPLAPVASLPPPASLPPKPSLPPPPVTTRPQSTAAPVKAPIPATQNFNARNGDRSGRPPAPVGTNSTRNTIATRSDPVAPPNNSSTRAAPSNQPHVAQPHWQEHDDDPWVTDPRGRGEMDYHWEQYPSPDRRADHWSPIRDHPPTRQSFPAHPSHYQPLSPPPRKRMHDSYPDDTPYKRQRFNERSRSPPPRRAYNAPDRAHTPPSPRYRSPLRDLPPRRTPSPPRYTPEPPVSPYASSVGSRRSYDWGPGPSAPHDRSYSPQQPRSRQLPARPPPPPPPVDRSMPDYKQQRPPSSGMQTVPSTSQPQAESASVWRRAVPMPIQVPVRDVHPDLLSRIDPGEGSTNRGRRGRGNGRGRGRGGANAARGGRGGSSRPLADRFQDGHRDLQSRITG